MGSQLTAITFSVDPSVKDEIDRIAASEQRSKSDVFREMYRAYRFNRALDAIQIEGRLAMLRLGLQTDDDIVRYAKTKPAKRDGHRAA